MPPKGWRKDSQGNYPTNSFVKSQAKLTIQDLLFPKSSVLNLAKEVQLEQDPSRKLVITKDASLALQRSATVFVNHLLLFARELAKDQDRKSCSVDDVLLALDHIGHSSLKDIVRTRVDEYQALVAKKRQEKLLAKQQQAATGASRESAQVDTDLETEPEEDTENKKQKTEETAVPLTASEQTTDEESTVPDASEPIVGNTSTIPSQDVDMLADETTPEATATDTSTPQTQQ